MINDLKINLEMRFVESVLFGSIYKFEVLFNYEKFDEWNFEYVLYLIYFYLIIRLFYVIWEFNVNKILIIKYGKENCVRVIFNLKVKYINKKENIIF